MHLYPSIVEILRHRSIRVDGTTRVDWHPLDLPDNGGQFACRFDLQFVKPGRSALPPMVSGVQQDRYGVLFADVPVLSVLKAGDRVRAISGPITGTFDVRNLPDKALGFSSAHHLEIDIVEVSQRPAGTYVPTGFTIPSGLRHLYASKVEVLRRTTVSTGPGTRVEAWPKIEDMVDSKLGVPGELMCRLDLQFLRNGKDIPLPVFAGRAQDRTGTLFCDVTEHLRAGDRVRCLEGDVEGTFEIRAIPDLAPSFMTVNHMEMQVIEVSQNMSGVITS